MNALIEEFLDFHLGTDGEPMPFAGRERELAQILDWATNRAVPRRALLMAPAAYGKSTMMAQVAHRLRADGRVHTILHPVSIRLGTRSEDEYVASVTDQVARIYGCGREEFVRFEDVLERLRNPPPGGRPIVVLIDGLDEALPWRPLFKLLPSRRVEHVRVLGSIRSTAPQRVHDDPAWPKDATTTFSLELMSDRQIEAVLTAARPDLDAEKRARVAALCHGQPLVARVLAEVDDLDAVSDRDSPLTDALEAWWRQEERAFPDLPEGTIHDVLGLVACAHDTLSLEDFDRLMSATSAVDAHDVRRVLRHLGRLIPESANRRYAFCHPFLGAHYRDHVLVESKRRSYRERFVSWVRAEVEGRRRGEIAPKDVPDYVVRTAHLHLTEVDAPPSEVVGLVHPTWLDAWLSSSDPSGQLAMIEGVREAVTPEGVVANLDLWVRCALAEAAARSRGYRLLPWIVRERIRSGDMTPEAALAQVEMMVRPSGAAPSHSRNEQAFALGVIADSLPDSLVGRACDLAIDLEADQFASAVFVLLPRLARIDLQRARRAAGSLRSVLHRIEALKAIAEHTEDETQRALMDDARTIAMACTSPWPRIRALIEIDEVEAAWSLALEHGADELRTVAEHLDEERRREAWRRIGELAVQSGGVRRHLEFLPDEYRATEIVWLEAQGHEEEIWRWARAKGLLGWLCGVLPETERRCFLDRILADLTDREIDHPAVYELGSVTEYLSPTDRARAVQMVVDRAPPEVAQLARRVLAAFFAPEAGLETFEAVIASSSLERFTREVSEVITSLSEHQRSVARTLTAAHAGTARAAYAAYLLAPGDEDHWRGLLSAVRDAWDRAYVWLGLLLTHAEDRRPPSFVSALEHELDALDSRFDRPSLLLSCAGILGSAIAERLVSRYIEDEPSLQALLNLDLLGDLAPRLTRGLGRELLVAAFDREPTNERAYLALDKADRPAALKRAIEWCTAPGDPTLALLAGGLLGSEVTLDDLDLITPPQRLHWAVANATWIDIEDRRRKLAELRPRLLPVTQVEWLGMVPEGPERDAAIADLFEQIVEALREDRNPPRHRVSSFFRLPDAALGIALHLTADQASTMLGETSDDWYGLRALIASRLPEPDRTREVDALFARARQAPDSAIALASLCSALGKEERDVLLSEVLALDTPSKPGLLNHTVRWAHPRHARAIVSRLVDLLCDESMPAWHRNAAAYVDALSEETRAAVVPLVWAASCDVESDAARHRIRTTLLGHVPREHLDEALDSAGCFFDFYVARNMMRDTERYDDRMLRRAFDLLSRWRSRQGPPLPLLSQLGAIAIEQLRRSGASPVAEPLIASALEDAQDLSPRLLEALWHLAPLIRKLLGDLRARAVGDAILGHACPATSQEDADLPPKAYVFICYRRDDSRQFADRLASDLRNAFGDDAVFMDSRNVAPGSHWPSVLRAKLEGAAGTIVIVGPRWLGDDGKGHRRIDDEADWVRREVARTLDTRKACLPILIEEVSVQDLGTLPSDVVPLFETESLSFHANQYEHGWDDVARWVRRTLGALRPSQSP